MHNREALEDIVRRHPDSFPAKKLLDNFHMFSDLYTAIGGRWHRGCGSYLFDGSSYNYNPNCLRKQEELYRYAMSAHRVLEIGVYVGHSLLIMLLANPTLEIIAIDYEDQFAKPAIDYLNSVFGNRITFICADAIEGMSQLGGRQFDLIHVDADHNDAAVSTQFQKSLSLAKENCVYIFDDYDAVRTTVDNLIYDGVLDHLVTPQCLWRNCITRLVQRSEAEVIVRASSPHSACSKERLLMNIDAIRSVNNLNIPGHIVEVGVYKGGSMIAMMRANKNPARQFYLFDTYEGMTAPCEHDTDLNGYSASDLLVRDKGVRCISSLEEVKSNISKNTRTPPENIHYIVGDITKTTTRVEPIAILRLDTDFYESTKFELDYFYDSVSRGGIIIIDDYGHWKGCKKAVDEFLERHPELIVHRIDYTGIYFVKV